MAQSSDKTDVSQWEWVGSLLQSWNPYLAAGVVVVLALIWKLPELITVIGHNRREGKKNDVEVAGKKKILDDQYRSLEDKRKRKKERKVQ